MDKDKQILISQANSLTEARYDLDLVEKRCLYKIIEKVRHDYIEQGIQRDLFDNMLISLSAKQLSEAYDEKHIKQAYASLRKLRKRDIDIVLEDGTLLNIGFINWAKLNTKSKQYEIEVSNQLMPFLVELASKFTTYDLTVAITLKSKYSQRFYEFCSQYKGRNNGRFFLTIEEIRKKFHLEDKYPEDYKLRKSVIDVAERELKELFDTGQSELYFEYAPDESSKEGKKIHRYWFTIHTKEGEQQDLFMVKEVRQKALYIYKLCLQLFKRDKKYCERVMRAMDLTPDIISPIFDRLTRASNEYAKEDLPAIVRYILASDYNIK